MIFYGKKLSGSVGHLRKPESRNREPGRSEMAYMKFFLRLLPLIFLCLTLGCLVGCGKTKISPGPTPLPPPSSKEEKGVAQPSPPPKGKEAPLSKEKIWFVSGERLHLRACAGLNCLVVATLARGEEVVQTGEKGDWIRIRVRNNRQEGWVSPQFLVKERPAGTAAPASVTRDVPKLQEEWATSGKEPRTPSPPRETFSPK
jgi:hypothetical protein